MQWTSAPNIAGAPLPQRARGYWKARLSAAGEGLERLFEAERAQLPPWCVVGFGSGIAAWFALDERSQWSAFLCIAAALALIGRDQLQERLDRAWPIQSPVKGQDQNDGGIKGELGEPVHQSQGLPG